MKRRFVVTTVVLLAACAGGRADIFVTNWDSGTVGQYSNGGATINASLVTGLNNPTAIALTGGGPGSFLLVESFSTNRISQYTLGASAGTVTNPFPNLITGLSGPRGIALSGLDLFVASNNGATGSVAKYTLGAAPGTVLTTNTSFLTGLSGSTNGLASSGGNLFVQTNTFIAEYTTAGVPVNTSLITGLTGAQAIAADGSDLYVASFNAGNFTIGKYTLGVTPGTLASSIPNLITGPGGPFALAVHGGNIFTDSYAGNAVRQYTSAGVLVNGSLVSGLTGSVGLAVTPEPGTLCVLGLGAMALLVRRRMS